MAKKEGKELVVSKNNEVGQFIEQAIKSNLPVETMEKLFALHREVKADQAREAFVEAMAKFQSAIPVIKKTKKVMNKDGRTIRYMYAPMDSVIEQIKKPLGENGLSYSWDVIHEKDHMKVTAKLTHIWGHVETSTFEIPIVLSEYMNSPQSYATAQSYAKRYTLLNVLGIGTADDDTDANGLKGQGDPKSIKARMVFLLRGLGHETDTPDKIKEAVGKYTDLKFIESNLSKIVVRLEEETKESQNDNANS